MRVARSFLSLAVAAPVFAAIAVGLACAGQEGSDNSAPPAAAAENTDDLLKILEPYVGGEWKCTGTWSTGEPLTAREIFTWGVGRKFINVDTFVVGPDGKEYQRYQGVYGVKDGKLVGWNFTYDGTSDSAQWEIDGNKWSTSRAHQTPIGGEQILHQSVELVEPDKFHWVVQMEERGRTDTLFDGYWVRENTSPASGR